MDVESIQSCHLSVQACGRFINNNAVTKMVQSSSKSPELLARYCDSLLKKRCVFPFLCLLAHTVNVLLNPCLCLIFQLQKPRGGRTWRHSESSGAFVQNFDGTFTAIFARLNLMSLFCLYWSFVLFCRWWCLSILRTRTCSRSSMRRCWPSVWSIRTAPATTRRPAWSPN